MNILMDGLSLFHERTEAVFGVLILILWGQVIFIALLRKTSKTQLTTAEYISISSVGWILPVAVMSVLWFASQIWLGDTGNILIVSLALIIFILSASYVRDFLPAFAAFTLLFFLSLILRFAFISELALPAYFDSAEHYRIISGLLDSFTSHSLHFPTPTYYHIGFHFISAAIAHLFKLNIADTVLVFGQVVLAILPFSSFAIINRESKSKTAAVLTCLLAGFGWHMPSHLMNWGKYPALLSLVCILLTAYIFHLYWQSNNRKIIPFLLSAILISTFIHSRTLILYGIVGIVFVLTIYFRRSFFKTRAALFTLTLITLATEYWIIQDNPVLFLVIRSYLQTDQWMLLLVLTLLPFAIHSFPTQTFFLTGSLSLLALGLFIPIPFPNFGILTLLDRPYLQMLLYLLLSFLSGFGLAGLLQVIKKININKKRFEYAVAFLFTGSIIWNASVNLNFYPSDCCQIITRDDLAAMQWINGSIPENAAFYIASTESNVTTHEQTAIRSGVDGGIWIQPLTSHNVTYLDNQMNFENSEAYAQLCVDKNSYIYVGGMSNSFDANQLDHHPNWYQLVFALPKVRMYQIADCK